MSLSNNILYIYMLHIYYIIVLSEKLSLVLTIDRRISSLYSECYKENVPFIKCSGQSVS